MSDDPGKAFQWTDRDLIVVPDRQQMAIAVYTNTSNTIVIQQRADWPHEEDDSVILMLPEHAAAVAHAILEHVANLPPTCRRHAADAPLTGKDKTAASRKRRQRERDSHDVTVEQRARNRDSDLLDSVVERNGEA